MQSKYEIEATKVYEEGSQVMCLICGEKAKSLTHIHFKGARCQLAQKEIGLVILKGEEYKKLFPNSKTYCKAVTDKMRQNMLKSNPMDNEASRKKIGDANRGENNAMSDPENRRRVSEAKMGTIVSQVTRDKMRESQLEIRVETSKRMKDAWNDPDSTFNSREYRNLLSEVQSIVQKKSEVNDKRSKSLKEVWSDPYFRETMSRIRKSIWSNIEYRDKVSKALILKWMEPEFYERMCQIRLEQVTEETRKRLGIANLRVWKDPIYYQRMCVARKDQVTEKTRELLAQHIKRQWAETDSILRKQHLAATTTKEFRQKMSQVVALAIAEGRFTPHSNHIKGYFKTKLGEELYYSSSYELRRFIQLEALDIQFTTKHGIIIPYFIDDEPHFYIPDILRFDNILEEIKPKGQCLDSVNILKFAAAEIFCENAKLNFNVVTEDDLFDEETTYDQFVEDLRAR